MSNTDNTQTWQYKDNPEQFNDSSSVDIVKKLCNKLYDCNLIINSDKFAIFDMSDNINKIVVEVKNRNINHDTYKTLLMNKSKICNATLLLLKQYKIYFVFMCLDGIYSYEYTKNSNLKTERGGSVKYGYNIMYSIPTDKLIKLIDL